MVNFLLLLPSQGCNFIVYRSNLTKNETNFYKENLEFSTLDLVVYPATKSALEHSILFWLAKKYVTTVTVVSGLLSLTKFQQLPMQPA